MWYGLYLYCSRSRRSVQGLDFEKDREQAFRVLRVRSASSKLDVCVTPWGVCITFL